MKLTEKVKNGFVKFKVQGDNLYVNYHKLSRLKKMNKFCLVLEEKITKTCCLKLANSVFKKPQTPPKYYLHKKCDI